MQKPKHYVVAFGAAWWKVNGVLYFAPMLKPKSKIWHVDTFDFENASEADRQNAEIPTSIDTATDAIG